MSRLPSFRLAGDNLLAEFGSAVDAAACALAVQGELARREADLPDDRRLPFRIGFHLRLSRARSGHGYLGRSADALTALTKDAGGGAALRARYLSPCQLGGPGGACLENWRRAGWTDVSGGEI